MSMLRVIALVLGLVLLGGPAVAIAQESTPEAGDVDGDEGYNAVGDPLVGTAVPYLNEGGDEVGVVTVLEVADGYDEFSEYFEIDEGSRYVAVEVSVEATTDQIEANPYNFGLQTVDGFFYSNAYVSREITSGATRDLESITVDVDDVVSGLLFFQVPEEAELARILWQPESGRLLVLADLREARSAPSAPVVRGTGNPSAAAWARG